MRCGHAKRWYTDPACSASSISDSLCHPHVRRQWMRSLVSTSRGERTTGVMSALSAHDWINSTRAGHGTSHSITQKHVLASPFT